MKEAGYIWDAERKELKKVEQKPAWSEEDEKVLHAIRNALNYEKPRNYLSQGILNLQIFLIGSNPSDLSHSGSRVRSRWNILQRLLQLGNEGDNKTSAMPYELRTDLKKLTE